MKKKLILLLGVMCLTLGLAPLQIDEIKTIGLRVHKVHHEKCVNVCVVVDKEMGL